MALELGNLKFKVTEVNLFATREAAATSPTNFGFSNVIEPLLPLQVSSTPSPNPQEFFWDLFHPTTQGYAVLANTIYRTLTGDPKSRSIIWTALATMSEKLDSPKTWLIILKLSGILSITTTN